MVRWHAGNQAVGGFCTALPVGETAAGKSESRASMHVCRYTGRGLNARCEKPANSDHRPINRKYFDNRATASTTVS